MKPDNSKKTLILTLVVFLIMYSISFVWNTLLTDNTSSIAFYYHQSELAIILLSAIFYFIISYLMVVFYLFAFADKINIFNTLVYGVFFGIIVYFVSGILNHSPFENINFTTNYQSIFIHLFEQTLGASTLGYILFQIR